MLNNSLTETFANKNRLYEVLNSADSMAKLAEKYNTTTIEQLKNLEEGAMVAFNKHKETVGKQIAPILSNLYSASGKFSETPNVKPRATLSLAGRIRIKVFRKVQRIGAAERYQ